MDIETIFSPNFEVLTSRKFPIWPGAFPPQKTRKKPDTTVSIQMDKQMISTTMLHPNIYLEKKTCNMHFLSLFPVSEKVNATLKIPKLMRLKCVFSLLKIYRARFSQH